MSEELTDLAVNEMKCKTGENHIHFKTSILGTSLMAQWLRVRLPMQGTQVQSLVLEDPTSRGANRPVCCNY